MLSKKSVVWFNSFFLISTFVFRGYTDAVYVSNDISSPLIAIKYGTSLLGIAFCLVQIFLKKRKGTSLQYTRLPKKIGAVVFAFLFISFVMMIYRGTYTMGTFEEIFKIMLPVVYAFCIINTFTFKEIYNCLVAILFVSIGCYILEIGIHNFNISNFNRLSFERSYSPFESHYLAGTSITLCAFFMYYRDNKLLQYISLVFAIFTFKRVAVIFAIIFLVLPFFIDINKKVDKKWVNIFKILFIVGTLVYLMVLFPSNLSTIQRLFNIDLTEVTMGRSTSLSSLIGNNFSSYGLHSSTASLNKDIEMDLMRILLETSIIGLTIFVNNYWDLVENNFYCMIFMFYIFLNLLASQSLTNSFGWLLNFLVIGCILYKENNDITYLIYKRRNHKKLKILMR